MKLIYLLLISSFLLLCCIANIDIIDPNAKSDMKLAKVTSYSLEDNLYFNIAFDEKVEIIDLEINKEKHHVRSIGNKFIFPLEKGIKRGEICIISLTARKPNGNITRASFRLIGKNLDIPNVLINEVSIAGTKSAPDRIELLILEDGNLAGMILADKITSTIENKFILPEMDVKHGDLVVIYWDSIVPKENEILPNKRTCYFLQAEQRTTLSSTKGIVVLYSEDGGDIQDAIIYNNDFTSSSYGNETQEKYADYLIKRGQWIGRAIDSSDVTSSRVLARLPSGYDTNSSDDWFVTKARSSTFGRYNVYEPYTEE